MELGTLFYLSLHLLMAIVSLVIDFTMFFILLALEWMGAAAWIFPLLLVALAFWCWKRRTDFGKGWTIGAEIFLPFMSAMLYSLIRGQLQGDPLLDWDNNGFPPAAWSMFLLLEGWTLFLCLWPLGRDIRNRGNLPAPELAERLLRRGVLPSGAVGVGVIAFLCGLLFLATVGILFTLILGDLIAQRNALWEYDSTGLLAGLGVLYGIQLVCLPRAALLLDGIPLERETGSTVVWMLLPGFAWIKANRLLAKLERRKFLHLQCREEQERTVKDWPSGLQ